MHLVQLRNFGRNDASQMMWAEPSSASQRKGSKQENHYIQIGTKLGVLGAHLNGKNAFKNCLPRPQSCECYKLQVHRLLTAPPFSGWHNVHSGAAMLAAMYIVRTQTDLICISMTWSSSPIMFCAYFNIQTLIIQVNM